MQCAIHGHYNSYVISCKRKILFEVRSWSFCRLLMLKLEIGNKPSGEFHLFLPTYKWIFLTWEIEIELSVAPDVKTVSRRFSQMIDTFVVGIFSALSHIYFRWSFYMVSYSSVWFIHQTRYLTMMQHYTGFIFHISVQ